MVVYCRVVDDVEAGLVQQQDGWWEIMVSFERLGVPIIRGTVAFVSDTNDRAFSTISYGSLVETGNWLQAAFDTQYVQGVADVLNAAKDMGLRFLTNAQYQEVQTYWLEQTKKLEVAEYWYGLNIYGVPDISEDRYSAFTEAVYLLDFDHPIQGE